MNTRLNGVLLGWQTKGIVADGMQNVKPLLPFVASHNVVGCERSHVPHVQASTRRVGEHIESVEFRFWRKIDGLKSLLLFPFFLPFGIYHVVRVRHGFGITTWCGGVMEKHADFEPFCEKSLQDDLDNSCATGSPKGSLFT